MPFSHWLVDEKRGVSSETPEKQQVSMMIDGINQLPAMILGWDLHTRPWFGRWRPIWGSLKTLPFPMAWNPHFFGHFFWWFTNGSVIFLAKPGLTTSAESAIGNWPCLVNSHRVRHQNTLVHLDQPLDGQWDVHWKIRTKPVKTGGHRFHGEGQ